MRSLKSAFLVTVFMIGACGKNSADTNLTSTLAEAIDSSEVESLAGKGMSLRVPSLCNEQAGKQHCRSWLGTDGENVGLRKPQHKSNFSIENVDSNGRFQLAAYPNCILTEVEAQDDDSAEEEALALADETSEPTTVTKNRPKAMPRNGERKKKRRLDQCKRYLSFDAAESGSAIGVVEDDSAGGWWQMMTGSDGVPTMVAADSCSKGTCLTLTMESEQLALGAWDPSQSSTSLWGGLGKVTGAFSDGIDYLESGITGYLKLIGKTITVDALGKLELLVEDARPGIILYSALEKDGIAALKKATGSITDGALYVAEGGTLVANTVEDASETVADTAVESSQVVSQAAIEAGEISVDGALYVAEYVTSNLCILGMITGLSTAYSLATAQTWPSLDIAFTVAFETFGSGITAQLILDNSGSGPAGVLGDATRAMGKVLGPLMKVYSDRYSTTLWEDLVTFMVAQAIENFVKGKFRGSISTALTSVLIGKLSTAVCYGIESAQSPSHGLHGASELDGIPTTIYDKIRDQTLERYENDYEDLCYALDDEINSAVETAQNVDENSIVSAWNDASGDDSGYGPTDVDDPAYKQLKDQLGCRKPDILIEDPDNRLPDAAIDDEAVLTRDQYWVGASTGEAFVACAAGGVAVGMCSSGDSSSHCYGRAKEILCAGRDGETLTDSTQTFNVLHDRDPRVEQCPQDYAVTSFCSSGGSKACRFSSAENKNNLAFVCTKVASDYEIDYDYCDDKQAEAWKESRLESTAINHVMVGMCTSQDTRDCGDDGSMTRAARFCPLKKKSTSSDTSKIVHTKSTTWSGKSNEEAFATCANGKIAVGFCSGGDTNTDCFGSMKEVLCATPSESILSSSTEQHVANRTTEYTECGDNAVITSICTSKGDDGDCRFGSSGTKYIQAFTCTALATGYEIDSDDCVEMNAKKHASRLFVSRSDMALVGICSSGGKKKCNAAETVPQKAKFCAVKKTN